MDSRREFLKKAVLISGTAGITSGFPLSILDAMHSEPFRFQKIGNWSVSEKGLPVYKYTGKLPFNAIDKNGKDANLPEDPYFLLGNYRMTLITHASGIYQFLTAERVWARINAAEQPNYGFNEASIIFENNKIRRKIALTGLRSIATDPASVQTDFGIGFARYTYKLSEGITCIRLLSVKPSRELNGGNPSFVVTVIIKNNGKKRQKLSYSERMRVNYVLNSTQYTDKQKRPLLYDVKINSNPDKHFAVADLSYKTNEFLVLPETNQRFIYDIDPPSIFMHLKNAGDKYTSEIKGNSDTLAANIATSIEPGEAVCFNIVIGIYCFKNFKTVQNQVDDLFRNAGFDEYLEGLYVRQWKSKLPDLSSETNEVLKREMLWNAHFIEASATYSDYYKETFIPQGTVYSYYFGDNISNRDHLQAALPTCYTNPQLAKSIIRYVIKHSDIDGEIKRGNSGYGYTAPSIYKESDEQLYFFNTISEYLTITGDYNFLKENVIYYPAEYGKTDTVLNILKKQFIYLRDEIGIGQHGLVKMLNSDWSDSFFRDYSPNKYAGTAESHLNSTMALAVFPKLINALTQSGNTETNPFIDALEDYRASLEKAFMKDLGNRKFSARAYLNDHVKFGIANVCIEPQGYLLQIPGLPKERKKEIYEYVKSKLSTPEKIGIRTREKPLWSGHPEGEDGGIWFSLEYPLLLGVATFDKEDARSLLMKFSFQNFAKHYPEYWVGQWTAADEVNSTLYREGLYDFWVPSQDRKKAFQGYCSHPHTWALFCYLKLVE